MVFELCFSLSVTGSTKHKVPQRVNFVKGDLRVKCLNPRILYLFLFSSFIPFRRGRKTVGTEEMTNEKPFRTRYGLSYPN